MSMSSYEGCVFVVEDDNEMAYLYAALLDSISLSHQRFSSGEAFLAACQPDWWGAVILDLRMPGLGGLEVLQRARARAPALSILVVTGHGEIRSVVTAMQAGAAGFLEKPFSNEELLNNVHCMLSESRMRYVQKARQQGLQERFDALSLREKEVAALVSRGLTSKDIAEELQISVRTVEVHRGNVLLHLHCDNSVEVAKLMLEIQRT